MDNTPDEELRTLSLTAARQIADACRDSDASLSGCGAALVQLLGRQAAQVLRLADGRAGSGSAAAAAAPPALARRLEDLASLAHARFYAYVPSDVPACWRQLYTDACILQFAQRYLVIGDDSDSDTVDTLETLDSLVRPLDMALILAGGASRRPWLHAALDALHQVWDERQRQRKQKRKRPSSVDDDPDLSYPPDWSACPTFARVDPAAFVPPVAHPVPRTGPLGLEGFQAYLDRWRRRRRRGRWPKADAEQHEEAGPLPLILGGLQDDWPACRPDEHPWAAPAYLWWRTLGGRRRVPVEVGRSYVDAGWTQAVVPFQDVLDRLRAGGGGGGAAGETVYLAQHTLFEQMPGLRDDIRLPDACYTVTGEEESDDDDDDDNDYPLINAWLGPTGTITPLHTDPHHNLLAQVVGCKYVRLYSPAQTAALHPRGREGGVDMGNTSAVDVGVAEGWDGPDPDEDEDEDEDEKQSQFRAIPYVDCILEPGDTLYIPKGWWHYVRGLSVSFSVSFWWD